jgi:L-ascorbate metabolism protein UlaG (beta-lactamase superfamily)
LQRPALIVLVLLAVVVVVPGGAGAQTPPDRVSLADWQPLPPADEVEVPAAARAARARLLGPLSADPRYATLHWVGVSSFIVTFRGHLFLFDAWEIVGIHRDYVPIGREELAALHPEAILLGHGHFDHAADAGYVAGRTGAVVLASDEQCDTVKADAARDGLAARFTCLLTGSQDDPPPGALTGVRLFEDVEPITILKNVHSAARPPGNGNEPDPFLPIFDPLPYVQNFNGSPEELALFLSTLEDPEGGTRMYHLKAGAFTLLLGDSAGPLFEHAPVAAALDRLPGCVDVMANAILGFDQPVSGLQDAVAYVAAGHPRVFLPTHADAWAPALSAGQAAYRDELAMELAALPNPPEEVDHLLDPADYVRERAYRLADPRWEPAMPGSSCAAAAGGTGTRQRLRLTVRPRSVRAGRRVRFRFRVRAAGRPVRGAVVRFAGRRVRSGAGGRAVMTRRLGRPGRYRARATRAGFAPGSAGVRARRGGPRLTG